MNDSEFKLRVLNSFEPLSEEEQKIMLYIFLDIYLDVANKKSAVRTPFRDAAQMVMDIMTKNDIFQTRKFILSVGRKQMSEDKDLQVGVA